jgi:hypothetical protein
MTKQDKQVEILREKSTAEKLRLAFGLFDFARKRIAAQTSRLNPELSPSEINKLVNQRFLK